MRSVLFMFALAIWLPLLAVSTDGGSAAPCRLCQVKTRAYHAPCLLDLSTGRVTDMEIYELHHPYNGQIAETQDMDYSIFRFSGCLAVSVVRNPACQTASTRIPKSDAEGSAALYCQTCRSLLAEADAAGYVVLDLYDPAHITVYPITAGAVYQIRDYTVSITDGGDALLISVSAHLADA